MIAAEEKAGMLVVCQAQYDALPEDKKRAGEYPLEWDESMITQVKTKKWYHLGRAK